jgi:pimeloyl-ACP methyl ester carboxylesterase
MREQYETTDLRSRLARHHQDPDAAFWGWNGAWLNPDFRAWNIESSVDRIAQPMLLIQGEDDEYGTVAQLESIQRRAKGRVEVVLLPNCGHSPHRDQPERTLAAMAEFIRSFLD